jgi:hypothetical protein
MRYGCVCALLTLSFSLHADLLLNTGAGNFVTSRPQSGGLFQGTGTEVSVATTTTLTGMAMDLDMPSGGMIKYMIWDGTDTSLLFSETQTLAASSTLTFVQSTPFSFTLLAGNSYFFGVISNATSDGSFNISDFFPPDIVTQNGLSTVCCNSNYNNFASPTTTSGGSATIALELFGTQASVPEPNSVILMSTMLLAVAFLARKRIARATRANG